MSHDKKSSDDRNDALDHMIRQAVGNDSHEGFPVDEAAVLNYLEGRPDKATEEMMQQALASSSSLRQELLEAAQDMDHLQSLLDIEAEQVVDTASEWQDILGRSTNRSEDQEFWANFLESIQLLFLKPAFAYSLMAILMAYPVYNLIDSVDKSGAPVLSVNTLHLDNGGVILRGDDIGELPHIKVTANSPPLVISLWSETPRNSSSRFTLEINIDGESFWSDDNFTVVHDPNDPFRIDIRLNANEINKGTVEFFLSEIPPSSSTPATLEYYRFVLE